MPIQRQLPETSYRGEGCGRQKIPQRSEATVSLKRTVRRFVRFLGIRALHAPVSPSSFVRPELEDYSRLRGTSMDSMQPMCCLFHPQYSVASLKDKGRECLSKNAAVNLFGKRLLN
ncbi:MAG: hypothetical protein QW493_02475 [Candidatus Bathyarchaeia archaeon]